MKMHALFRIRRDHAGAMGKAKTSKKLRGLSKISKTFGRECKLLSIIIE